MIDVSAYLLTIWAMAGMATLMLVQILIADFAGIRVGHAPGSPVPADPRSFFFRATRAHANSNESVAIFGLLAVVGILVEAPAGWLNFATVGYVMTRAMYTMAYYANWALFRSIAFGISLAMLAAMLVASIRVW